MIGGIVRQELIIGIHFEHYNEHNFMLIILHGSVTDEQLHALISRLLEDQYSRPGKIALCAMCKNISTQELSFKGIFSAAKRIKKAQFRKNAKLAIVAVSTASFGLAKIYQAAAKEDDLDEIRVIRNSELDSAISWIEIEQYRDAIKHQIARYETVTEYTVN